MRTHRLLQGLKNFAWATVIILFLAASARCANAQGDQYNMGSGEVNATAVYVYSELDIDTNLSGDAYTEEDSALDDVYGDIYWLQLESTLSDNLFPVYDVTTTGDTDTSFDTSFLAYGNASYDLNAVGTVCQSVGSGSTCLSPVASADSTVPTSSGSGGGDPNNPPQTNPSCNGSPSISSNDPSGGDPGDSGTMTISGDYMTNLDGSLGSVSYWSDADGYGDPAGYIDYVTFGSTNGNSETITVPYSIDPNAPLDLGSVVVQTDCGTAYGPDFNISTP